MGYEIKLIIGLTYSQRKDEDGTYMCPIATIDLSKCCFKGTALTQEDREKPAYYYGEDGNTKITKDMYGDRLYLIDPNKVLERMKESEKFESYRRYRAAIPLLESLIKDFSEHENLQCILFGH